MGNAGVSVILPIFGVMLTGYLAGRFHVLMEGSSTILSRFVFVVSLPSLIFISLSRIPVKDFFDWSFLGTLGGGMLATFCLSFLIARLAFPGTLTALGLHGLAAMYSSTAYIGLPVIMMVFGNTGLVPGIIGAVITGAFFLPLAIILAEIDKNRGRGKKEFILIPLRAVLRTPVVIAVMAGLAVSATGITIPGPITTLFELLSRSFVPCALFSAGLFLSSVRSLRGNTKEILWLVIAKTLLHPLITWWLAYHVFELEGVLPAIAVIQAALPSGIPVFILAQQYSTFVTRASTVIVATTAVSVLTLSALLFFLGK